MNAFSKIDMAEVTRLTRAGKLAEAVALIQGRAPTRADAGRLGATRRGLDPVNLPPIPEQSQRHLPQPSAGVSSIVGDAATGPSGRRAELARTAAPDARFQRPWRRRAFRPDLRAGGSPV